jgi:predicted AlkP superfamily phosphohydrolase/phosphomutase
MLELVDEDTSVVVISDHGLGSGHYGLAVHTLLEEAGLLATAAAQEPEEGAASWFADHGRCVDFRRTKVYMPVPGSYGFNVNLRGRQVRGAVAPRDRARVLDSVVELLAGLTTPDGARVFRAIPREDAYAGPRSGRAPDLVAIPEDETVLPVTDLVGAVWRPSVQTGLHRYRGMWAHRSPRVRPGRLTGTVPLADTMPTLLVDLGAAWAQDVHGRPRAEIFVSDVPIPMPDPRVEKSSAGAVAPVSDRLRSALSSRHDGATDADGSFEDAYTSGRLREMGYL